jgi:hypothetical protein
MSTSVVVKPSLEERNEAILRFHSRVKIVALQCLNRQICAANPFLTNELRRELTISDYQTAGYGDAHQGLVGAATSQGKKLTQAYADVAIRNAIKRFQSQEAERHDIDDEIKVKIKPTHTPAKETWGRLQKGSDTKSLQKAYADLDGSEFDAWAVSLSDEPDAENAIPESSFQLYPRDPGLIKPRGVPRIPRAFGEERADGDVYMGAPDGRQKAVYGDPFDGGLFRITDSGEETPADTELNFFILQNLAQQGISKLPELWGKLLYFGSKLAPRMTWPEIAKECGVGRTKAIEEYNKAIAFIKEKAGSAVSLQETQTFQQAKETYAADYDALCQSTVMAERTGTSGYIFDPLKAPISQANPLTLPKCNHGVYWADGHAFAWGCESCQRAYQHPNQAEGLVQKPKAYPCPQCKKIRLQVTTVDGLIHSSCFCGFHNIDKPVEASLQEMVNTLPVQPEWEEATNGPTWAREWDDLKVTYPAETIFHAVREGGETVMHTGRSKGGLVINSPLVQDEDGLWRPAEKQKRYAKSEFSVGAVYLKGNRFDHPVFGIGVIKADWTPWSKGLDVLFQDGQLRNVDVPRKTFGTELRDKFLSEKLETMNAAFRYTIGEPMIWEREQRGVVRSFKHGDIPDWDSIPNPTIGWVNGFNPFMRGPSSSIGSYLKGENWEHEYLPPSTNHQKIHYAPIHKDFFELNVGPDAGPWRIHANPALFQHYSISKSLKINRTITTAFWCWTHGLQVVTGMDKKTRDALLTCGCRRLPPNETSVIVLPNPAEAPETGSLLDREAA